VPERDDLTVFRSQKGYALAFRPRFFGVLRPCTGMLGERRGNCIGRIGLYPGTRARRSAAGRGEAEGRRTLRASVEAIKPWKYSLML
jgi:hypothetical protein